MYDTKPFFRRSPLRTMSVGSAENKYQGILWAESSAVSVRDTGAVSWVKLWSTSNKKYKTNKKANGKCGALLAAIGVNNCNPPNVSRDFNLMSLFFLVSLFFHPLMLIL